MAKSGRRLDGAEEEERRRKNRRGAGPSKGERVLSSPVRPFIRPNGRKNPGVGEPNLRPRYNRRHVVAIERGGGKAEKLKKKETSGPEREADSSSGRPDEFSVKENQSRLERPGIGSPAGPGSGKSERTG